MNHRERIEHIRSAGIADNTVRSYESDLKYFWGWVKITRGADIRYPVSPALVEAFVLDHIEGLDHRTDRLMVEHGFKDKFGRLHTINTIRHRLKALGWIHRINNFSDPGASEKIADLLRAAKRIESKSGRVPKKSRPITQDILEKMVAQINRKTKTGIRNAAILMFAFYSGGRRQSEVAGAKFEFLTKIWGGYTYLLHRSKTDQNGIGRKKLLRSRPARYLTKWIKAGNITDGYLFRRIMGNRVTEKPISNQAVNYIVKKYIEAIGEDPEYYSAHGLRRGFITTCARKKIPTEDIMQLTDHKNFNTIYGYYQEDRISKNPATKLYK
ncbi:MAG: tyrosine-type recombinase/integrase [Thermodesulfobacteriota bacterium]|nr:tyrosine-type recombinase/integrase [Thermodesulfobacteriota bacterium]